MPRAPKDLRDVFDEAPPAVPEPTLCVADLVKMAVASGFSDAEVTWMLALESVAAGRRGRRTATGRDAMILERWE